MLHSITVLVPTAEQFSAALLPFAKL